MTAARKAGPSTAPVCTSTPLGMSTAITGMPSAVIFSAIPAAAPGRSGPVPEIPTTPSTTRSVSSGTTDTTLPPALRKAASPARWARSGFSSTALADTPRRRRKVNAHKASPPLSPEPTTPQTLRPATTPARRDNSSAITAASPYAARRINAPSGRAASSGASASLICSAL
ncbi:Uncharacterised protein [Mycobacteroides abscessus subsp. abscessus]|nr:Uncharacterised protein [Mycobacteroides abscessus subsp. abscessus]